MSDLETTTEPSSVRASKVFSPSLGLQASLIQGLRPLLDSLIDLKRIRSRIPSQSLAKDGFVRSWSELTAGRAAFDVARRELVQSLIATGLAGIDTDILLESGLTPDEVKHVFLDALHSANQYLPGSLHDGMCQTVEYLVERPTTSRTCPQFVHDLLDQPRAGATCPGRGRLVLTPMESHAEHCYVTAIMAALFAELTGADPGLPFLAGLAHHLHNATLPDAGYAGEVLLGDHLEAIFARLQERSLSELDQVLATQVRAAIELTGQVTTAEARAFQAADVLDRVLEMAYHDRVARFRIHHALEDFELVHPGPLKEFQDQLLVDAGLICTDVAPSSVATSSVALED